MLIKLKGDERTVEAQIWEEWLCATAKLCDKFAEDHGDDPLAYNETASVSLLCSAAASRGWLGLAEYALTKRAAEDRRRSAPGRCDLYLLTPTRSWAFEFKQLFPWGVPRRRLQTAWDAARRCAECLPLQEADARVAGLMVSLYHMPVVRRAQAQEKMRNFANAVDYAWELGSRSKYNADTFFFFEAC
jgi:hypothetical protein